MGSRAGCDVVEQPVSATACRRRSAARSHAHRVIYPGLSRGEHRSDKALSSTKGKRAGLDPSTQLPRPRRSHRPSTLESTPALAFLEPCRVASSATRPPGRYPVDPSANTNASPRPDPVAPSSPDCMLALPRQWPETPTKARATRTSFRILHGMRRTKSTVATLTFITLFRTR